MDWERYKKICDAPNVFSRWMLEQTSELLDESGAALLTSATHGPALEKPDDHRGDVATDMFEIAIPTSAVEQILERLRAARAANRTTSGTRKRGLGGFEEAWTEYLQAVRVSER